MVGFQETKLASWIGAHGLSGSVLKLIAVVTMIIDHIGLIILDPLVNTSSFYAKLYIVFRIIGRISFPLFAFLIAEGIAHTKDIYSYFSRILIFAIVCEIPYDIAVKGSFFIYNQAIFSSHSCLQ